MMMVASSPSLNIPNISRSPPRARDQLPRSVPTLQLQGNKLPQKTSHCVAEPSVSLCAAVTYLSSDFASFKTKSVGISLLVEATMDRRSWARERRL